MSKMLNVIGIIGVLLLVSLFGCSKESHSKDQVIENSVSSGIQQNDDDSGHFASSQDKNAIKDSEPVEKKVETSQEPSLLELGEWNLEALLKYVSLVLIQLREDEYGGFIANLFISEDSSYMQNDSMFNTFSKLIIEFRDDELFISVNEMLYKSKSDKQNNINGESNDLQFSIPRQLFIETVLSANNTDDEILLNCYFNNNDGYYILSEIETLN